MLEVRNELLEVLLLYYTEDKMILFMVHYSFSCLQNVELLKNL